jgi:serine/threonine-protein kinase
MLAAGTRLGDRYELEEPVARGGMGEVWRAQDPVLGRTVAVKVMLSGLSTDPGFAERFRTEARAMAALSDPGIVEVYDYGQSNGVAYLVMPFVTGESLHHLLHRVGPLPPREAMTLVAQAAHALHQAHRSGIVHRDVKPGNLLVRPDGRLVLTDFGIAGRAYTDPVAAGGLIGTAAYLAPEQVWGDQAAPTSDVYALGVVAYECLTLSQPFAADSPTDIALMRTRTEPIPLPDAVPPTVRHVVMRAISRDPGLRWPSAQAMAEAATRAARGLPEGPWVAAAPVPQGRSPIPTAALPAIEPQPREAWLPWTGLIPVAAGLVLLIAATAIALSSLRSPDGGPAAPVPPPASTVQPGEGSPESPQPTQEADRPDGGAGRGDDGRDDDDGDTSGRGGGGNGGGGSGAGGGGGGSGSG